MAETLNALLKQPYWIIALLLGAAFVAFPSVTVDKDYVWTSHPPSTLWPVLVGVALLILSAVAFCLTLWTSTNANEVGQGGLDLTRVEERDGVLSTQVNRCEIRVVNGRVEDYAWQTGITMALPCNEYFDDRCVDDSRSALGAYVSRVFDRQSSDFVSLIKHECKSRFGVGEVQQKTEIERAESFGVGRCLLLTKPLNRPVSVALISTTTQRAGEGLSSRISYLFNGMHDLFTRLADERINQIAMPLMGAGHGGIDPPLALVGLLLAVAEGARYGKGGQRLRQVTVVLFRPDANSPPQVAPTVVRRALALIGSRA